MSTGAFRRGALTGQGEHHSNTRTESDMDSQAGQEQDDAVPVVRFSTVQQATVTAKRLMRESNVTAYQVNSRYCPNGEIQTFWHFEQGTSDATFAKVVAVLTTARWLKIRVSARSCLVSAVAGAK